MEMEGFLDEKLGQVDVVLQHCHNVALCKDEAYGKDDEDVRQSSTGTMLDNNTRAVGERPVLMALAMPKRVSGCVLGFDRVIATRFTCSCAAISLTACARWSASSSTQISS